MELSKDMVILLFFLSNGAKAKRKLLLSIKEKVFYVSFSFFVTEPAGTKSCSREDLLLISLSANQKQQQLR